MATLECCDLAKKLVTLLDLCVSSLRRGHANLLCIVPILTDGQPKQTQNWRDIKASKVTHFSNFSVMADNMRKKETFEIQPDISAGVLSLRGWLPFWRPRKVET